MRPLLCPPPHADNESKWRQLGELALSNGQLEVARTCFTRAKDLGGLLLLHSSHGDAQGMAELAALAGEAQRAQRGPGLRAQRCWPGYTSMLPLRAAQGV